MWCRTQRGRGWRSASAPDVGPQHDVPGSACELGRVAPATVLFGRGRGARSPPADLQDPEAKEEEDRRGRARRRVRSQRGQTCSQTATLPAGQPPPGGSESAGRAWGRRWTTLGWPTSGGGGGGGAASSPVRRKKRLSGEDRERPRSLSQLGQLLPSVIGTRR